MKNTFFEIEIDISMNNLSMSVEVQSHHSVISKNEHNNCQVSSEHAQNLLPHQNHSNSSKNIKYLPNSLFKSQNSEIGSNFTISKKRDQVIPGI